MIALCSVEAPLQGCVFRGEIEINSASCVYLCNGVEGRNLCVLAFVEHMK